VDANKQIETSTEQDTVTVSFRVLSKEHAMSEKSQSIAPTRVGIHCRSNFIRISHHDALQINPLTIAVLSIDH
jgi:hypothetical protein